MSPSWQVRPAAPDDVHAIDALVRELAVYEREPDAVEASPEDFAAALFGSDPRVHCHVAEVRLDDGDPEVVGMALWYVTFSTWRGRHGIWLEDLFVRPEHRGLGLGRALLEALAAECTARGWARLEWWVLDWNSPAHGFYRSLGAAPQDEWTVWRLDGDDLDTLGSRRAAVRASDGHPPPWRP
ncbi:MAG: GNAT family N-acetyltransferase [Actinomycetota bacterium]